jgi:hypothetical protein
MRIVILTVLLGLAVPTQALALDPGQVRNMPVTEEDERILLAADELLKDEARWNRQDDRRCNDDEEMDKRSLFCALHRASVDVLGHYNHRKAALQYVRLIILERTPNSGYAHRLQDSNNDPQTTHDDIRSALAAALAAIRSRVSALP